MNHFITLHNGKTEDWHVCVEHISAIRVNHDKERDQDNGVWVYLTGDQVPVLVNETIEEIVALIKVIQ